MANVEPQPPPAWVRGTRQTPHVHVRKPVDRHLVTEVSWEDQGERGDRNTMIEPWVDVQADLDAINRGEAIVDRQHATAWINGRLWGFHVDTGTVYPMEGEGLVRLNQLQYFALRTIARYNGLNSQSEATLSRHPDLSDEDRDIVRRLWRMREEVED